MSRAAHMRGPRMVPTYRNFYVLLFIFILFGLALTAVLQFWPHQIDTDDLTMHARSRRAFLEANNHMVIESTAPRPSPSATECTFHTCFDVYHCGYNDDNRISVYIYPNVKYVDEENIPLSLPVSKEYSEVISTVFDSVYYEPDPDKACLFLPTLDMLNQNSLRLAETAQILASLSSWNDGANHLLFNMLPGSSPDYSSVLDIDRGKAIIAGGGFSSWAYRRTYDVSVPVFNPLTAHLTASTKSPFESRDWLLVSAQTGLHIEYKEVLRDLAEKHNNMLLVDRCTPYNFSRRCLRNDVYQYPQILQEGSFCLVLRGSRLGGTTLSDVLQAGCIPVIVADTYILPFSEVLDWKRASVTLREDDLHLAMDVVRQLEPAHVRSMRRQVRHIWENYFSSMRAITLTTLQIINDRVFPYAARKYDEWNDPPNSAAVHNPLFLPLIPPKSDGFTAVILTYDRLESLFQIIHQVSLAPSLNKVLVVWNNQQKAPPPAQSWPKINKPLKVVQTHHNKLSNRFYPYDEIETEAILALDDDIQMLTTDELEFGYEVWRQFSDRLVGFPSRLHLWDNATQAWKYESEWTSEMSLVLTGAAFYHKYYSYLYTNSLPGNIKQWVDEHMNCEDIAMNFLIANTTGKAPIKVSPRQKFKCPECLNQAMLSADLSHMIERSECITKFAEIYGTVPLKTVEFRADPVLYKENIDPKLKWYSDIGSL